ncbi:TetR/AcrR family transcriptional regulator [Nonomuraea sp. M3C6]|uniref:TetR/AcrR family transcriptional regulator n=1 Tax=Nonomuraea marmarensis TaxID=3351344 RepID=A0ABW7A827_9ACTN
MPDSRRSQLLTAAYDYVLEHGLSEMSLRPLAKATGTSPRVLLYLFGSKDDLVREILAKGRAEELRLIAAVAAAGGGFDELVERLWAFVSAPEQRATIRLFFEAYVASLRAEPGPWRDFARQSVHDWLRLLTDAQPGVPADVAEARATRTLALLRGQLLDLLACDEPGRLATP